ncbi:MAG TPA: hypothetical protein VGS09_03815 [Actinomycetota bacterium]|jgi:hypothetical protein|nr:hypothetical protein [Actinomycetota bacterium]
MPRFELPPDLTSEEERIVLAALELALKAGATRRSPWVLAGRVENLRTGVLQARRYTDRAWTLRAEPWARRSTWTLRGRGDAK